MFKNINEIKGFPAASREWKNSTYSYNENTIIKTPHNDTLTNAIVSMAFHLIPYKKANTKSKRMRDLIRRNTTRQLIVSKPDIKQTSDKATVTIYIFDREKFMYIRRLFFVKNSLYRSTMNNISNYVKLEGNYPILENNGFVKKEALDNMDPLNIEGLIDRNIHFPLIKLKKTLARKIRKHSSKKHLKTRLKKLHEKRLSYKFRVNNKIFTHNIYKSLVNKRSILNNLFMFKFLKWIMSYYNIKVLYSKLGDVVTLLGSDNKLRTIKLKNNLLILLNDGNTNTNNSSNINNNTSDNNNINTNYHNINSYIKLIRIPSLVSLLQIRMINKVLLSYVKAMMINHIGNSIRVNAGIRKVFNMYRNKYLVSYGTFYLRKQKLTLSYLVKLFNNKVKYNKLMEGFKSILGNIYGKSIKLNLVNLKYLHLNSDIFSEAVSIKLRKKTNNVLRILNTVLKLVKIPKIVSHSPKIQNIAKLDIFNWYEAVNKKDNNVLKTNSISHMLDSLLYNMFPKEINYNKQELVHNIIYSIRHKWIRGVRLEAKGRLTKRYTASRSLFKFRYKGSLRNLEHLKKPHFTREQASIIMLRNSIRPNVQYTFTSNRKRIGVYGIKGWISGY